MYSIVEYIEPIISCIVIFCTGNVGIYILAKSSSVKNAFWRSSFNYGLGLYLFSNYFRLIYLIPSFFINLYYDFYLGYFIYVQVVDCIQHLLILSMSISRLIASCQKQFSPSSMILTSILYLLIIIISLVYGAALFINTRYNVQGIVGLVHILINILSFIISFCVVIAACCVKNQEKRHQMNYAWVTLFMSLIFLIEYIIAIVIGIVNYHNWAFVLNYSLTRTIGLITNIGELVILVGGCLIFAILWNTQKSTKRLNPSPSSSTVS